MGRIWIVEDLLLLPFDFVQLSLNLPFLDAVGVDGLVVLLAPVHDQ